MKNVFGKELNFGRELSLLEKGYEWFMVEEYYLYKNDKDYKCRVAAVDTNNRGKIEMYLMLVTARGYRAPTATTGCRLRTGNPDFGR